MFPFMRRQESSEDQQNGPYYKKVQTTLGIVREVTDLFRMANMQWKPSKRVNITNNRQMEGKLAVVTGADDGVGRDVAIELAKMGFKVIMGSNDVSAADATIAKLKEENDHVAIRALKLDSSSLASVRLFADVVTKKEPKIDLLVNSENGFNDKQVITKEGFEKTFVENYLSQYLVTRLLLKSLVNASDARIVNVSSTAHHFGSINLDDLNHNRLYLPFNVYNQSKLAQVMFTRELAKRLMGTGINVYAVNPGILRRRMRLGNFHMINEMLHRMSNTTYGAQAVLYIALDELFRDQSGCYYSNYEKVEFLTERVTDDKVVENLWNISSDLVKLDKNFVLTHNDQHITIKNFIANATENKQDD